MEGEAIAALIAGMAGLVTIFFGRAYWSAFKALIDGSQAEIGRLRVKVEAMQKKLDEMERELHGAIMERERLGDRLDNQVGQSQQLLVENQHLRQENKALRARLRDLESMIE